MQSYNYAPKREDGTGGAGWKMHADGSLEINGTTRLKLSEPAADGPKPFVVIDGVTYIRQEEIDKASIQHPNLLPEWSVKVKLTDGKLINGKYVVSGIGLGLDSQILTSADRFAISGRDAGEILKDVASLISKTELCNSLVAQAEKIKPIADAVREVLREELKPGGILHRK